MFKVILPSYKFQGTSFVHQRIENTDMHKASEQSADMHKAYEQSADMHKASEQSADMHKASGQSADMHKASGQSADMLLQYRQPFMGGCPLKGNKQRYDFAYMIVHVKDNMVFDHYVRTTWFLTTM